MAAHAAETPRRLSLADPSEAAGRSYPAAEPLGSRQPTKSTGDPTAPRAGEAGSPSPGLKAASPGGPGRGALEAPGPGRCALERFDSMSITQECPGRTVLVLSTSQRQIQLPLDAESAVTVEDTDGELMAIMIAPAPGAQVAAHTVAINDDTQRRSFVVTFSLPLRAAFHVHGSLDSGQMRLVVAADISNNTGVALRVSRVTVSVGGQDRMISDFEIDGDGTVQLICEELNLEATPVWIFDAETEKARKALQLVMPKHYAFPNDELPLAEVKTHTGLKAGKKLFFAEDLAWVFWDDSPDFDFAVHSDAEGGSLIFQLRLIEDDGAANRRADGRGRRKPKALPMSVWLLLPPALKTPVSEPDFRNSKVVCLEGRSRKMIEYLVERAEEQQFAVGRWDGVPR